MGVVDQIVLSGLLTRETKQTSELQKEGGPLQLPSPPKAGQEVAVTASGNLTLHGVTKEVTIPLSVRWSGEFIDVAGQLPIVLGDFQINPPNVGGFVSVAEDGILELQLSFVPA